MPLLLRLLLRRLSDSAVAGIGLDYCLLARKKGASKVIIADLRLTEAAQRAVQSDPNLMFQACDVTKWKDLQDIIEVSLQRFGDVPDVYVASAGVFEPVCMQSKEQDAKIDCCSHFPIFGKTRSLWKPMVMPMWTSM